MKHTLQVVLIAAVVLAISSIIFTSDLNAGTITSTATGGKWSATTTWVGGAIPGASDDVVIANAATVTIDANVTVASITVGQGASGTLTFDNVAIRVVTVFGNVTVAAGGAFIAQAAISTTGDVSVGATSVTNVASTAGIVNGMNIGGLGISAGTTVTAFTANTITLSFTQANTIAYVGTVINIGYDDTLSVGGNLTNNGTFDMSRGNSAGICHVTFNKAGDQTLTGTGTTTRFRSITLNKAAVANRVLSNINVSAAGTPLAFVAGTWEQNAGRFTATSGSINIGSLASTSALNIIGSGSASISSNINVFGSLLVNTTDSLIVGAGTGTGKIDLTNVIGAVGTFTKGTVYVYGKINSAGVSVTTFNGATVVIDPKNFTATDYAFRQTTGTGGTNPLTFTSGTITILNPSGSSNAELAMSSSVAPNISGTSRYILGQGAGTVPTTTGYRINLNANAQVNDLTINTGSVGVSLLVNGLTVKGTLTITSCGTLGGAPLLWTANTFLFNGSAAQVTGAIMPATVRKVIINNPAGVTSSQALTITDTLQLISGALSGPVTVTGVTIRGATTVENSAGTPREFSLQQNYPNPFNPSTNFTYQVAKEEFVSLKMYDALGREVASLVNEVKQAGTYGATWNAVGFGSGIYFCKMQAGSFMETRKLILMK